MKRPMITTNPARCRDCYRCVRHCDVKAIRVDEGQAQVESELCIFCGTCISACPQKAKDIYSSIHDVQQAIAEGRKLIASVAPSAPAYFDFKHFSQIESALLQLGFYAVEETAVGAEIVAAAHREYVEHNPQHRPVITSSCPVIVYLIEKYYPDLIPHLAPIVSPMIAHSRLISDKYGSDAYIVFIGPCIAKKMEMFDESPTGVNSAAVTFRGLDDWFKKSGISFDRSEPTAEVSRVPDARLFALEGGLIGTAGLVVDMLSPALVVASGLQTCRNILADIRAGKLTADLVELMACTGGCINGPAMTELYGGIYTARQKIIDYQRNRQPKMHLPRESRPDLSRRYTDRKKQLPEFSEAQIEEVLQRINKYTADDEFNCGACGYHSCREKAVATLRGMAEVTMCIPYMRNRSESLRQVVMDVSPNAIIIVDDRLVIQDVSPSAENLFSCSLADVKGKHISQLIPVYSDFISVRDTGEPVIAKVRRLNDNLVAEQSIVNVTGQSLLVAMIRDRTEHETEKQKFRQLRAQTLEQTQEVVRKQMRVAHEIAHLLGETTAESKMIVSHLAKFLEEDESK